MSNNNTRRLDVNIPEEIHTKLAEMRDGLGLTNSELLAVVVDFLPNKEVLGLVDEAAKLTMDSRSKIVKDGAKAWSQRIVTSYQNIQKTEGTLNSRGRFGAADQRIHEAFLKLYNKGDAFTLASIRNLSGCNSNTLRRWHGRYHPEWSSGDPVSKIQLNEQEQVMADELAKNAPDVAPPKKVVIKKASEFDPRAKKKAPARGSRKLTS